MFRWVHVYLSVGLTVFFLCLSPFQAAAQSGFSGQFRGLDDASGLTISLSQSGNNVQGRIAAPDGSGQVLSGALNGGAVESALVYRGQQGRARITLQPLGLAVIWSANNGTGEEVVFLFRRNDLQVPQPSSAYVPPPPPNMLGVSDPVSFLHSYEFWPPDDVSRIYSAIEDRFRTLIQMFPAVQTDVIWKLCGSVVPSDKLASALRGQGVTCAMIDTTLKAAQSDGRFNRYKERVRREKVDALLAVECARGNHTASTCAEAARRTQAAATALETVATVLNRI